MKIYFAGSIRGGRGDVAVYEAMIAYLRAFGEVLTEHVGNRELTEKGDDGPDDRYIHDRDMRWLAACDLVVAEVSVPSLGVGYELGWASALGKPVLCLYRPAPERSLSAMIGGGPGIETAAYSSIEEARNILNLFIQRTAERIGVFTGGGLFDKDGFDDDAA
ncbi:MAG: nucleoside 2-deoxyribosyltransferase [Pseudomonadota bacterium]